MASLVALIGFSFVVAGTPGPNNVLLWTSGAAFGFRSTLRHVFGTALGICSMALLAAAGLGTLFTASPPLAVVMKVAATAYLLYLAVQITAAHAIERAQLGRPLGILQAAAFQAVNPKGWIVAIGAVTAFSPPDVPPAAGAALVALTMAAVIIPTSAVWALAGGMLSSLLARERTRQVISLALAALLALSVVEVWL